MKKSNNPFALISPVYPPFTVGNEAYSGVAEALRTVGSRVLLIGGHKALAAGLEPLQKALNGKGVLLSVAPFSGDCTLLQAKEFAQTAKAIEAAAILGMGGGKALDVAKAAAYYAGLPVITLPTIAATCAAVTALSVMHHPEGSAFSPILFLDRPPLHAFLHTGILSRSPAMYLRAGIGDSLTKHIESSFKAGKGDNLLYTDRLGLAAAKLGYETLMSIGREALTDAQQGNDSAAFRLAVQCCVVNTGIVSLLVDDRMNGALAHSLFYALRENPKFSAFLHGDVVAWGSLVQLMLEGKAEEARRLKTFLHSIGVPAALFEMGIPLESLRPQLSAALRQQDMADTPYPVTEALLMDALEKTEALERQ